MNSGRPSPPRYRHGLSFSSRLRQFARGVDKALKVSVIVITYNHELFIRQAIQSILMQESDFDFEIIISEDCSTDSTRSIVNELSQSYPQVIRLLLSEENLNTGEVVTRAFHAARGEYVAILDGDDYWISKNKLQEQAEFLDNNPDFSACFHRAYNLFEDGTMRLHSEYSNLDESKLYFTLLDVAFENPFATCSGMFRRGILGTFPSIYYEMPAGDWILNVLYAEHGKLGYIRNVWGVRRVHSRGFVSSTTQMEKIELNRTCVGMVDRYLNFKYHEQASNALRNLKLMARAEELRLWGERASQDVVLRDSIIRELQDKLAEQTAWAVRSAAEVAQRDGVIRALRAQLAEQSRNHPGALPNPVDQAEFRGTGQVLGRYRKIRDRIQMRLQRLSRMFPGH
jgi:glycosyltransferase involved in cell wall biosynthesis